MLELKLTGMQGDVMKESMNVAMTLAWKLSSDKTQKAIMKENSKNNLKDFFINARAELEKNNYGYSKFNKWEHVRLSQNVAVVEQNFTRYLNDGSVMGTEERMASYILGKDEDGNYKIYAIILFGMLSFSFSSINIENNDALGNLLFATIELVNIILGL